MTLNTFNWIVVMLSYLNKTLLNLKICGGSDCQYHINKRQIIFNQKFHKLLLELILPFRKNKPIKFHVRALYEALAE